MSSVVYIYDTYKQNYSFLNLAFFKFKIQTSIYITGVKLFTHTEPAITINRFQIENVVIYDHLHITVLTSFNNNVH